MDPPKIDWKRIFKNTFTYGLALEIAAIGTGYYLYREYKTNQGKNIIFGSILNRHWKGSSNCFDLFTEFRERVEDQFPLLTEMYGSISGMYLKVMPKRVRDKILDEKTDEPTTVNTVVPPTQK